MSFWNLVGRLAFNTATAAFFRTLSLEGCKSSLSFDRYLSWERCTTSYTFFTNDMHAIAKKGRAPPNNSLFFGAYTDPIAKLAMLWYT